MDKLFTRIATLIANAAGQPVTFIAASLLIVLWGLSGPIFNYSDTWQLVVNTATTIITFLMVFLIQNSQNRDGAAMQAKLDEIIRALDSAREEFIGIEHLTDAEITGIRDALEQDVGQTRGKPATTHISVDRLLRRR